VAHRWAGGRWLATGGGGYDAYRVVPRVWALTWLAGAHREPELATPAAWRDRWASAAGEFGTPGMPLAFLDEPNAGRPVSGAQEAAEATSLATLARVRSVALPRLVREAEDRGWWRPSLTWAGREVLAGPTGSPPQRPVARPAPAPDTSLGPVVRSLSVAEIGSLALAPRTVAPFDVADVRTLLMAALADGARVVGAVVDGVVVGLAVAAPSATEAAVESLLAIGVAPAFRGRGVGRAMLRLLVDGRPARTSVEARIGVAERDVVDPGPVDRRLDVGRRLLAGAGFELRRVHPDIARDDPSTIVARLPGT